MTDARDQQITDLQAEVARLTQILNTPLYEEFVEAVMAEAPHQRWRWAKAHDAGKTPRDWCDLIAYLSSKARTAHEHGDRTKALHHTISTAAALLHWHEAVLEDFPQTGPGAEAADTNPPA